MEYGLIGRKLGHSYSKLVHSLIASYDFELIELDEEQFHEFMRKKDFKGINVTIPYKEKVLPYLDYISDECKAIGACNTIVNRDGKLYGYNTDYYGLKAQIQRNHIHVLGEDCYIFGTGGTGKTAKRVLEDLGAKSITKVSRTKKEDYITYEEYSDIRNPHMIVNTTPCGMYPDLNSIACDINPYCEAVVEVVYNPFRTKLIQQADEMGIKDCTGMYMLVYQAIKSSELFLNTKYSTFIAAQIEAMIKEKMINIVLIGMPMSGKTLIGKRIASLWGYDFIDLDAEIEKKVGMSIAEYFAMNGEKSFREVEAQVCEEMSKRTHTVISTGGGIIKDDNNMKRLSANAYVVYLTRDIDKLIFDGKRPLTRSIEEYEELYEQRKSYYEKYAEITVDNSNSVFETIYRLKEGIDEIADSERT